MKKKVMSILLASALAATMLAGCGSSPSAPAESDATEKSTEAAVSTENSEKKIRIGFLSVLNISEEELRDMNNATRKAIIIMTDSDIPELNGEREIIYYDNLDAMQMALEAGDIDSMNLPKSTADYLVANNDKMEIHVMPSPNSGGKLNEEAKAFLERQHSTGFAFMMREDSEKLRDDFDDVLDDMKEDGSLIS